MDIRIIFTLVMSAIALSTALYMLNKFGKLENSGKKKEVK